MNRAAKSIRWHKLACLSVALAVLAAIGIAPMAMAVGEHGEFDYIVVGNHPLPIPPEPPAEDGFGTITSHLVTAYGYKQGEGINGWTVYTPGASDQFNSLDTLYVGRGYWINVTEACTLQWGSHHYELDAGWNLIGWVGA